MFGLTFRRALGLTCLGLVILSWIDLIPGDELIATGILGPVALVCLKD